MIDHSAFEVVISNHESDIMIRIATQLVTLIVCTFNVCTLLAVTGSVQAGESRQQMQREVAGHQLHYLLQTPEAEKPDQGWPLLLFLHGYGECGDDLEKVKKHGPPKLIDRFEQLSNCVVVSPQCPRDSWWRVESLKALVEEVVAQGNVDDRRLYVTGLSMGGYGTWSFISHYPEFFTAAVPICGGGDPLRLPLNRPPKKKGINNEFDPDGLRKATRLPIWTFHGAKDRGVPLEETERLVDLLKDAGSKSTRFTVYPNRKSCAIVAICLSRSAGLGVVVLAEKDNRTVGRALLPVQCWKPDRTAWIG